MWIPMFIFDLLVFVAPIIAISARLARQYVTLNPPSRALRY